MNIDISKNDSLSDFSDKLEILFLDTFSSQNIEDHTIDGFNNKELSVGLVQFSNPVIIHELRIIPLSTLVSAESLKGVRLGATIPSSFDIHFYVNDLKAKESSTFLDIGSFSYKEHDRFIFKPQVHVATDGLFLQGQFKSVTLAVLGVVTDLSSLIKEQTSNSCKIANEIKDIDEDSNNYVDDLIEIKEPDNADFIECPKISTNVESNNQNNCNYNNESDNSKSEHFIIKEEVHSLSPSPEKFSRVRSQSPHQNVSTPKSNSSNSSRDIRSKKSDKGDYKKSKFSSSRSNSISPPNYSSKTRSNLSPVVKSYRRHRTSDEREVSEVRSSSHLRDRYDDDKYHRSRSRRSRERSPQVSHSRYTSGYNERYSKRSRSRSKESAHSKSHSYRSSYRSLERTRIPSRSGSRDRKGTVSIDRNNDARIVHSGAREENRSICNLTSKTRSSAGYHYEAGASNRDMSPRSSPKHQYHSTSRSRRSRSISPSRKRKDYHRSLRTDSFSPHRDSNDTSLLSPEHKKSRCTSQNIASPTSSSASFSFTNKTESTGCSRLSSPKGSSRVIETIASPISHKDEDDDLVVKENMSPLDISSPHSSISNVSLKSIDRFATENSCDDKFKETCNKSATSADETNSAKQIELFEPLSPSEDISDIEPENELLKTEDSYEQISLSSDVDMDNDAYSDSEKKPEKADARKGELLEVISSDEEYADELNAALSSDKIDYAKNYLDSTGSKYDDDEIDNAFDMNKNLFNPFLPNQLESLKFPYNSNNSTTFLDVTLFNTIIKFVEDKFGKMYSQSSDQCNKKGMIDDVWVKNVEQLATDIMKLSSPIYYSIHEGSLIKSEQELKNFVSILVLITKDGLNFDRAISQKELPFKVRHLKAGIKLLIALFSSLDLRSEQISTKLFKLLLDADLPYDLLILYNKPFMTLSLRLLILNGLIIICDFPEGIDFICNKQFDWPKPENFRKNQQDDSETMQPNLPLELKQLSIYQYVLTLILTQQKSRLTSVFEELLDKIHLFELFKALSRVTSDDLKRLYKDSLLDNEVCCNYQNVHAMMSQLVSFFNRLSNRIHRPLRLLPNICQYEIKTAVHTSIPLLLLSSNSSDTSNNAEMFNYMKTRLNCKHISCSSSKIGFFSQKAFYRYFKNFETLNFIENLLKIIYESVTDPNSCEIRTKINNYLSDIVITLLDLITSHQQGLKFLLEDDFSTECTNRIHKCLIDFNEVSCKTDLNKKFVNFGAKFITRLYSFNLVDNILSDIYRCQPKEMKQSTSEVLAVKFFRNENPSIVENLFKLFTMVYLEKSLFRQSVISILTMEHNFDAIMSFIVPITSQIDASKLTSENEKFSTLDSISFVYSTKLALTCIQYIPENQLIHFYDSYGQLLFKNIENVQSLVQNSSIKLHKSDIFQSHIIKFASLINWLAPLKNGNFNSHEELTIRKFITILKKHHDNCREKFNTIENYINRIFYLEPELVTTIKVLVSLCDPSSDYAKNQDPDIQLKYRYSLVHCYYFDCMSYILTLLEAVSETCLRPSHQTSIFSFNDSYTALFLKLFSKENSSKNPPKQQSLQQYSNSILNQGSIIIEFIRPCIRLLRLILNFLLSSMGHKFCDASPIPVLLKVYNFLDGFENLSSSSDSYLSDVEISAKYYAKSIQNEIIDIFLTVYTGVFVEHSESEELLKKSVWNKMLKHLFDFTLESPKYFVSGLNILSRILPETLPVNTGEHIDEMEISNLINFRKLWSAHLHVLNNDISEITRFFILSDSLEVQIYLRVVSYKICDLFTPSVVNFSKSVTEFLIHNINIALELLKNYSKTSEVNGNSQDEINSKDLYVTNCLKIFNFILDMFSANISFRIGILSAFYYFGNCESGRKDSSKICLLFNKLFEFLNDKKFEKFISIDNLLSNMLSDEEYSSEINETQKLCLLLNKYFDENLSSNHLEIYKFPDKLASSFVSAASQMLNHFFSKRAILSKVSLHENDNVSNDVETNDEHMNELDSLIDVKNNVKIYSQEFLHLSVNIKIPSKWNSLSTKQDNYLDKKDKLSMKAIDFAELSKKYFNSDFDALNSTFTNLYSPIVEAPEPPEKSTEETTKLNNVPIITVKRSSIRGRGRSYGHRLNDPFRSRPPNTSRPPSMHVDDFVALEQRQDPLASLVSKSRSNHLQLHVNSGLKSGLGHSSGSLGVKHSEYIRKKNHSSHHSIHNHTHLQLSSYSNYSNSIKSSLLNNANSLSSTNNAPHYNKQP